MDQKQATNHETETQFKARVPKCYRADSHKASLRCTLMGVPHIPSTSYTLMNHRTAFIELKLLSFCKWKLNTA